MASAQWRAKNDTFGIVKDVKFKQVRNKFQAKLSRDVKKINSSKKVLVFEDKARNLYMLDKNQW